MTRIKWVYLIIFPLLICINLGRAQAPDSFLVSMPVHGYLVFEADSSLILADTFSGAAQVLDNIDVPRIHDPHWSLQGDAIAYNARLDLNLIYPFSEDLSQTTIPDTSELTTFVPQSWNADGTKILGLGIDTNSTYYDLMVLDLSSQTRQLLRRDFIGESLIEDPELEFYYIWLAAWNPVFEQWILVEFNTFLEGTEESEERPSIQVVMLFNQFTGEKYILNDFIPDAIFHTKTSSWSDDGRILFLETESVGTRTQILRVLDEAGNWDFELGSSAEDLFVPRHSQYTLDWLGVRDLLLVLETQQDGTEHKYFIAQIINNEWHLSEFFQLSIPAFSTANFPNIGKGDWILTASQEERYRLSCLFDQAMPLRLEIGGSARVNFTDGTPLRLWMEPDFDTAEITQLPEGTEFTIVGGKACLNSDDYYRFWQIQLADGTSGWAVEANTSDYFIEPISQ
jgi:hypothetical protein